MNSPASPAAAAPAHPLARRPVSSVGSPHVGSPLAADRPTGTPEVFDLRDRITVITPTYDWSQSQVYADSMRRTADSPTAHFRMEDGTVKLLPIIAGRLNVPNDSHIDRARNVLTNIWYKENKTRFALSIDADIEFHEQDIARTWLHLMQGHKLVFGLYAMKCLVPTFVANVLPGKRPDPETGLVEILHGGTGWCAHDRTFIEKLREHPDVKPYACSPNTPWAGEVHYTYYSSGPGGDKNPNNGHVDWLSEDWMLCQKWRDLGGVCLADTNIKLRHLGRMLYPPAVSEIVDAFKSLRAQKHPALPKELI